MNPIMGTPAGALADKPIAREITDGKSASFPFLRLPIELRKMIYRPLLVSPHRVHLDCIFLNEDGDFYCKHRLDIYTPLLRVCIQIST
jgi:hypothetical protein